MSKRVFMKIAYDGTNYCGWQMQINGITVEEVINKALSDLLGEKIAVIGASRTDSGVHALANVFLGEGLLDLLLGAGQLRSGVLQQILAVPEPILKAIQQIVEA